jgi:uncharacterized DUF497 family protein
MTFEWDEHKNELNIQKHGLSFEDLISRSFITRNRIILERI